MPILNYTTSIDYNKTVGEIQATLSRAGAKKIIIDYDEGLPIGITFHIQIQDGPIFFSLPCNYKGVFRTLRNNSKVPKKLRTEEQAIRVGWRILKNWIVAQLAIVEAELATITEVFLPYALTREGTTLYEHITGDRTLLLTQ